MRSLSLSLPLHPSFLQLALSQLLSVHSLFPLFPLFLSTSLFLILSFSVHLSFQRFLSFFLFHFDNPGSPESPFYFLTSLCVSFFLSAEFLIIESWRDRERLARTRRMLMLLLRHAIVPNLRPAFYRTVDFDGFIRTLYSHRRFIRGILNR